MQIADLRDRTGLQQRLGAAFPALAAGGTALLDAIMERALFRHVDAGTVVFSERTPCTGFPLLLEGSVRVVQRYPNGRELELYRVTPGALCVLSGSCLLSDVEYNATAIAETNLDLVVLPPDAFHALLAAHEPFRRFVFAGVGSRLSEVMQVIEAIAYQRLDVRLARLLLERAGADGHVDATHQSLADRLGSVREIVSRLLRGFADRGWVQLGRERITIADRAALAALSNSG